MAFHAIYGWCLDGASGGFRALDKHQLHVRWLVHAPILRHMPTLAGEGLAKKGSLWHIVRHGAIFARQPELAWARLRVFHGCAFLREH